MANAHERLINSLMKSKKDRVQRAFEKWDLYRRLRENNEDDTVGQIQEINVHRATRAMALGVVSAARQKLFASLPATCDLLTHMESR